MGLANTWFTLLLSLGGRGLASGVEGMNYSDLLPPTSDWKNCLPAWCSYSLMAGEGPLPASVCWIALSPHWVDLHVKQTPNHSPGVWRNPQEAKSSIPQIISCSSCLTRRNTLLLIVFIGNELVYQRRGILWIS